MGGSVMVRVLLAHAEGESSLAEPIVTALRSGGYEVLYEETVLVGESLIQEASKALAAGSPVVLCGTIAALGTGWAHQVVNAARMYMGVRIFALQMEERAYLQQLSLDGRVAAYWQDPAKAINELLDALQEYYPLKGITRYSSTDHLESRYRELALRTYDIVDLANLPVTDRNLATRELLLRSLYVALRVAIDPTFGSDDSDDLSDRSRAGGRQIPLERGLQAEATRWPVGERIARSRRLVVLGDPGAGKSTLLRWMATAYLLRLDADPDWRELPDVAALPSEDWLPILVRCRDLDGEASGSLEQMVDHHLRKLGIKGMEVGELSELLLGRLSDGRSILLLDGLDEIAQPAARAKFCRQVEQAHVAYPEAPIVVTSRIVGYREMGLRVGRGFEHVTVLDLTADDKDEFVRRWCAVTEPIMRREMSERELIRDIHSTDRIERLTGNPMLLTTMALVKKKVGKLPSKRADLYREAVDVLLNWRSDVDELLDPYEAMPQLEYVAYAMCEAGVQQLRSDEITRLLARMRNEFPSVRAARRHSALEFIQLLERRTGILVEIGKVRHKGRLAPVYEFRHLTFQEYMAGLALVAGRFPSRDRRRSLAENVSPLAAQTSRIGRRESDDDDPAFSESWWEALRLCVMSCNDDDVDSVLLAIADVRKEENPEITARSRAVLAISCLSDEPNVSEEVALKLIDRFIGILRKADGNPQRTGASRAIDEVGASLWGPLLARRLVMAWLSTSEEDSPLGACAGMAGSQRALKESDALREWLAQEIVELSGSEAVDRVVAALCIMVVAYECRVGERAIWPASASRIASRLMGMLKRHGREAEAAAWAIGWLAGSELSGVPIWTPSPRQLTTLVSHSKSRQISNETLQYLLWALPADYPRDVKLAQAVANHLGNAGHDMAARLSDSYQRIFPNYADPILSLFSHSSDATRDVIARLLGQLGDPRAVEPLIGALTGPDDEVQEAVAAALGRLGDPRAVEPLIGALTGPDDEVQEAVAAALGRLGDPRAVEPLIGALTGPDDEVQEAVLTALEQLGDPRAVEPLIGALTGPDGRVQEAVAAALGQLGDPRAVEPLIGALTGPDGRVQEAVAAALGQLGDPRAVEPLIGALTGPDGRVQEVVAAALGQLGDPRAVEPLIGALTGPDGRVQEVVAAALGQLGDPRAVGSLQNAMRGTSPANRMAALWGLAQFEEEIEDRILLSRDADGVAPGIDPAQVVDLDTLSSYLTATGLSLSEASGRYENLRDKYLLDLNWKNSG